MLTISLPTPSLITLFPPETVGYQVRRIYGRTCQYIQAVSFPGHTGGSIFQVRHGESLKRLVVVDVGFEPTHGPKKPWSIDDAICKGTIGVLVRLTTRQRLTNSLLKLPVITSLKQCTAEKNKKKNGHTFVFLGARKGGLLKPSNTLLQPPRHVHDWQGKPQRSNFFFVFDLSRSKDSFFSLLCVPLCALTKVCCDVCLLRGPSSHAVEQTANCAVRTANCAVRLVYIILRTWLCRESAPSFLGRVAYYY